MLFDLDQCFLPFLVLVFELFCKAGAAADTAAAERKRPFFLRLEKTAIADREELNMLGVGPAIASPSSFLPGAGRVECNEQIHGNKITTALQVHTHISYR